MNDQENQNEELVPGRDQKSPKVELNEENTDRCLCPGCPTYNSDSCPEEKKEKIFCSVGGTYCNDVMKSGCICGDCPNFQEYDLKEGYFCVDGEATEGGEPVMSEGESEESVD